MKNLHHSQMQELSFKELFHLPVMAESASPYFTGRDIHLVRTKMIVKFIVEEYIAGGGSSMLPYGAFVDISTNTFLSNYFPTINIALYDTDAQIRAAAYSAIVTQAGTLGYSSFLSSDIIDLGNTGLQNIPQAAIADAATDAATNAPTNLNVLTTLLGTLTGEVNATNSKQNDLAAKYNDLAGKFNTLVAHLESAGIQTP